MTPFETFRLWRALSSHFKSSYDYFKYAGKINVVISPTKFAKSKFYHSANKLSKVQFPKDWIIANLVATRHWIGDIAGPEGEETYRDWCIRTEAINYKIRDQIALLNDDFESNFKPTDGNLPKLLVLIVEGKIWQETPIALDRILGFMNHWDVQLKDNPLWRHWSFFYRKYAPFLNSFEDEKIRKLMIDRFADDR